MELILLLLINWSFYLFNFRVVLGKHVNVTQPLVYNHPVTKEKVGKIITDNCFWSTDNNFQVFCVHLGYVDSFVEENRQRTTFDETTNIKRDITETIESNKEKLVYSHKVMEQRFQWKYFSKLSVSL